MKVFRGKEELRRWRSKVGPLAFIPTMGCLHEGHLSLVARGREAVGESGCVLVSIFVNPTQFDRQDDLENYPRDEEADLKKCREAGVDAVYVPLGTDFYPSDHSIKVSETSLSRQLCGASRPGHFEGVCLVLTKFFSLIRPDFAVFGRKDYQQLAVVSRLVRDLDLGFEILASPTYRESDGLAMSSRNQRLSPEMRCLAPLIFQGLQAASAAFTKGHDAVDDLLSQVGAHLPKHAEVKLDYLELVDGNTLEARKRANCGDVIAIAIFFGPVRLIDNLILGGERAGVDE